MKIGIKRITLNQWLGIAAAGALVFLVACTPPQQISEPQKTLPNITVSEVVSQRLTEWDEFTGRLHAPQTVDLRPRVSGYIDLIVFKEGSMVEAGDPLFLIDNRSFKAEVKRLKSALTNAKSRLDLAQKEQTRATELASKQAISQEVVDSRNSAVEQAQASLKTTEAELDIAKLNLSFTHVKAPIRGRVSSALITRGNYVNAGQSVLTKIVSTTELYAYFDADEHTHLKYSELAKQGSRSSSRKVANPVYMGLANDDDFPYQGVIDFVDNSIDQTTGTIRGRAVFPNPDSTLIPGLFARIKVVGSATYEGILIQDKAISTDLNNKFVLVLNRQHEVEYRRVVLGEKLNGLRIIKSGLKAGEKVVVNGLQRVRPGSQVTFEVVPMASQQTLTALRKQQQRIDNITSNKKQLADKKVQSISNNVVGG